MAESKFRSMINSFDKKIHLRSLFITIILLYSIMPVFSAFITATVTTYAYMVIAVLTFALLLFDKGWRGALTDLKLLLPFVFYIVLTYFIKTTSLLLWGYQSLIFLIPMLIGIYLLDKNEDYSKIVIFAFFLTLITTTIGCIVYPNASRYLAYISTDDPKFYTFVFHNIGGFDFIYECVLLYPFVIIAYKRGKIHLLLALLATVLVFALTIAAEYTIAIFFCVLISLLYFVKKDTSPKKLALIVLIAAVVIALIIALFGNWISELLVYIANHIPSKKIAERLLILAGGKSSLESSEIDDRLVRYEQSISIFLRHPFIGGVAYNDRNNGGHSFILNHLANFGLIGLFSMLWMYHSMYRLFYKPYRHTKGFGFVIAAFCFPILLSFINPGMWGIVYCLYGPILMKKIYPEVTISETAINSVSRL